MKNISLLRCWHVNQHGRQQNKQTAAQRVRNRNYCRRDGRVYNTLLNMTVACSGLNQIQIDEFRKKAEAVGKPSR